MSKSPEEWFRLGAEAMRSEISVMIMLSGNVILASKLLTFPTPRFQVPEQMSVGPNDAKEPK